MRNQKIVQPAVILLTAASVAFAEIKDGREATEPHEHIPHEERSEPRAVGTVTMPVAVTSASSVFELTRIDQSKLTLSRFVKPL